MGIREIPGSPWRARRMRIADELIEAFLEGDREMYMNALILRNAVTAEADLDRGLLADIHLALRKAALQNAGRQRLLSDFESAFSAPLDEGATRAAANMPQDLQSTRLEAAEDALELLKSLKGDPAEKARHLRGILAEAKLPPKELVASVNEALLDALMKPPAGMEPGRIREVCKKFGTAFSEMGI
jgi:hypothetical protein